MHTRRQLATEFVVFASVSFATATAYAQATPGPRTGHALVYHERLGRIVLLDGMDNSRNLGPTVVWTWDGRRWTPHASADAPMARYVGAAVYDRRNERVISYGGRVGVWEDIEGDMWAWSGGWSRLADSTERRHDHHALAFDFARNRVVTFGGVATSAPPGPWSTETWEWDGQRWMRAATEGPSGRITTMVYDEKRREVVLFGGTGEPSPARVQPNYSDTWTWNGTTWRRVSIVGPTARSAHAMAYDRKKGVVLLYGGLTRDSAGQKRLSDFWQWDGKNWKEISQPNTGPGPRVGHVMAYDAGRSRVVLFGGAVRDTMRLDAPSDVWEWDGSSWTRIPANDAWPNPVPGWPRFIEIFQRDGIEAAIDAFRNVGGLYWEATLVQAAQQLARPERNVDVVSIYLAGLRRRPESVMMLHRLAGVYDARGDTVRATEYYRAAMDAAPRDSTVLPSRRARIRADAETRLRQLSARP